MVRDHRPTTAFLLAALSAAGGLVVWVLAFHSGAARRLDHVVLDGFVGLRRPLVGPLAENLVSVADPKPFALLGVALVCLALARSLPRVAAVVIAILAGANLTTYFLQSTFTEARDANQLFIWPSGHTTAIMSLVLCLVLVSPPRLRPLGAAAGGLLVVAVVFSILTLAFHLPSDVLGGFAVASAWTWLSVGGLWAAENRWPTGAGREAAVRLSTALAAPAVAAAIVCLIGAGVVALRTDKAVAYAESNTAFVAAAGGIGVVGLSLVAILAVLLRRQ